MQSTARDLLGIEFPLFVFSHFRNFAAGVSMSGDSAYSVLQSIRLKTWTSNSIGSTITVVTILLCGFLRWRP